MEVLVLLWAATFAAAAYVTPAPAISWADVPFVARIDVGWDGAGSNGHAVFSDMSDDGRVVAFASAGTNLLPNDTKALCGSDPRFPYHRCMNVYVRDFTTRRIDRVSVGVGGEEPDGDSSEVSVSVDGRFAVIWSSATNLVLGDANGVADYFVANLETGALELASVNSAGEQQDKVQGSSCGAFCGVAAIDGMGRHVVFGSWSDNLVEGPAPGQFKADANQKSDVFVRDRSTGKTELVSTSTAGIQGNDASWSPAKRHVSTDGRYVVFESMANNLVLGVGHVCTLPAPYPQGLNCPNVYLRDLATHNTRLVSTSGDGTGGDGPSGSPSISRNGRFVAFDSRATNLVPGVDGLRSQVYLRDMETGTTEIVSLGHQREVASEEAWLADLSGDGRFVAFVSKASNLVPQDLGGQLNVFVRDRVRNVTLLAGTNVHGVIANNLTTYDAIGGDGHTILLRSQADNLVEGDDNKKSGIYLSNVFWAGTVPDATSVPSGGIHGGRIPSTGAPAFLAVGVLVGLRLWRRGA